MVSNPSCKSPSFCSPGEPLPGPKSSEGFSVHPMADSFYCRPSASGAPPRANVLDGFNGGSTSLSDLVEPSIPLIGSSRVGPTHLDALDAGATNDGPPVPSLRCSAQCPSPSFPEEPLLFAEGRAATSLSPKVDPPRVKKTPTSSNVNSVQNGPDLDAPPNHVIDQLVIPISNSFKALQVDDPNDYFKCPDPAPNAHPMGDGPILPTSLDCSSLDKSSSKTPNGLPLSSCLDVGGISTSASDPSPSPESNTPSPKSLRHTPCPDNKVKPSPPPIPDSMKVASPRAKSTKHHAPCLPSVGVGTSSKTRCGCFGQLMMANAPFVLVGELSLDCLGAADVVVWNWPDVSLPCGVSKGWNLLSLCYCGVAAMWIAVILVYLAPVMCYLELQWHNGSTVCCGCDQLCLLVLYSQSHVFWPLPPAVLIVFVSCLFGIQRLVVDVVAITEPLNAVAMASPLPLCCG
ncbi:hypothetical protein Nepgr_031771 [Nepenthes gracilis]|uniref:Uncharacterized protein n=1 Tax=Nepenthes gracilis TaxID=150966 RepID=A0AAD3THD0_NEPGR|nr:hypothetical protein Nepgr_031771 [Nepenthes gracilis]